jgi:hypothetical protein
MQFPDVILGRFRAIPLAISHSAHISRVTSGLGYNFLFRFCALLEGCYADLRVSLWVLWFGKGISAKGK